MATFVVTGFNRSRSKYYRPSYTSDLAPIYEDKIHPTNRDVVHRQYVSTVFQSDSFQREDASQSSVNHSVHDYETGDAYMMTPARQYRQKTQPSYTSGSMLHGIMSSRFQAKPTDVLKQSVNLSDNNNMNKHINNNNNVTGPHSKSDVELQRKTSLYQEYPVGGSRGPAITPTVVTAEPPQKDRKWYKLQPGTSMQRRLPCPAEGKFKKRCFAFCFGIIVLIIATFIFVSVEGWTYKATGKGFSGEEPLWFGTGVMWSDMGDNFTDIRNDNFTDIRNDNFTDIRNDSFTDIRNDSFTDIRNESFHDDTDYGDV